MFGLFGGKKLDKVLNQTKSVKIKGVIFRIKKISPLSYVDGSQALLTVYDTYSSEGSPEAKLKNMHKVQKHFTDVFMAAVLSPVLTRSNDLTDEQRSAGVIPVENLFTYWEMATELYEEIMALTYGKKKLKQLNSQKISS